MTEKQFREKERKEAMKKGALKAKRKRRRRAITAVIVVLILLIAVFAMLSVTVLFKIESIYVEGNTRYSQNEIISVAELRVGDPLFLIGEKSLKQRLQKLLPYVVSVEIDRELPSSLYINIEETTEEICFFENERFYLANKQRKILSENTELPENLPVIVAGEDCSFEVGEKFLCEDEIKDNMLGLCFSLLSKEKYSVTLINTVDLYDTYVIVEDRLVFRLGSSANFENKVAHMEAMLKKMSASDYGVVDLTGWSSDKPEAFFTEKDIKDYRLNK